MKIAFTILCHNYGRYLAQAIESCLVQSAPGWEVETWVMDDASTDETQKVCASYVSKINISRSERNLGFGATLGRCITEPRTDFVCLLDADDWCNPDKLERIAPHFEAGAIFVNHRMIPVDEHGATLDLAPLFGATSAICVQRRAAMTVLPVRNEVSFYSLLHGGRGVELAESLVSYRIHSSSMQRATDPVAWRDELAHVYSEYLSQIDGQLAHPPWWLVDHEALRLWRQEVARQMFFARLEGALHRGSRSEAFRWMMAHVRTGWRMKRPLTWVQLKMAVRVLLCKPYFGRTQTPASSGAGGVATS